MIKSLTPQQIYRKQNDGVLTDESGQTVIPQRHIISVLLENQSGSLNRVLGMFSARGFNLESVAVGETEDPTISRLTLVTTGNTKVIRQMLRQLNRMIDTLKVEDLNSGAFVEREICLIRVKATPELRATIKDTIDIFEGKVVDITVDSMMFEVTGPTKKIKALMHVLEPFGILDIARSGRVALPRPLVHGD
jgi:acetolactate synthase-1/3 small subunit